MYLSEAINLEAEQNSDRCVGPQAKNQTKDKFDWNEYGKVIDNCSFF